jgi:hypothetical protein
MSDLLESQDIFYPRNFDHLRRKVSFSTPTPDITQYKKALLFGKCGFAFGNLIWPHNGRFIWPHLLHNILSPASSVSKLQCNPV